MNRSRTLAAAPALGLLFAVTAACGSSSDQASSGSWAYTDGRGTVISLEAAPTRIVAQSSMAAALTDLGVPGIVGVFGPLKAAGGGVDRQAEGIDPGSVADVTAAGEYGSLDLEKLASLRPDVVATYMYVPDQLWYVNPATQTKLEKLVPTAVVDFEGKTLIETLDSVKNLAKRLGADLGAKEVAASRADFDRASDRLKAVGAELRASGTNIVAVSPATDVLYVSDPSKSPDLSYYVNELKLPIVQPKGVKAADYFETLSWEKADKYRGDIALYDARVGEAGLKIFDAQPTWKTVPAGKEAAYVPWQSVAPPSFDAYAKIMNEIADGLEKQR
ncbi:ABC transporter substrate-binding protein [Aeromicrobium sp.]|uniref:ABC transporter substrate-binding protein n=1 Tax=Aeromicrobium sp. TaxID=1871063 RepID=UPI0019B9A279|nr:ABC transporter substrate-binding protein [Aeromicrobium sp.]MBC7630665.1 ABC transporter substrate-binding protein [Aeromicrobium sp.]